MRILLLSWLFFIPFYSIFFCIVTVPVFGQCLHDQRSLLLQLKNSLEFSTSLSTKLVKWDQSSDCSSWCGVTWGDKGHVIGLNLSDESISGGINNSSSPLFSLQYLQSLNLAYNNFHSTQIPPWFNRLTSLTHLNLSNARFAGQIPIEISQMTRLVSLDFSTSSLLGVSSRKLENPIPIEISQMTRLVSLDFSTSSLLGLSSRKLENPIPIEISQMTRLASLDFSTSSPLGPPFWKLENPMSSLKLEDPKPSLKLENPNLVTLVQNLKGLKELYLDGVNISAQGNEWCRALSSSLPDLQVLSLSNCHLSGPLDSSLVKLQSLSVIRLDNNNLSVPVPEFFANFTNLTSLSLISSGLNGAFPMEIFQVTTLQTLDLSNNGLLHGYLPEFPQNASLQILVLSNTNFSGNLPDSIGNLKRLSRIELANCNFNGTIPNSMASLTQLVSVDISSNSFTGPFPSFSSSKNLTWLNLAHNGLNGSIPSTGWGGLSNLVSLDLQNNSLSGNIPLSLFYIPSLQKIQLSRNQFTGQVSELSTVSSSVLDTLDLSSNKLQGPLPLSVFGLKGLRVLALSSNNFNGTLELNVIQQLRNLSNLDLSYNNFSINTNGTEPTSSSFPHISTLKLASCNLSTFPDFLKNQFSLAYLDLSDNQIHGEIPNWIWKLNSLRYLNLSCNFLVDLEGPLVNLSSTLSVLDLHSNQLRGKIPILQSFAAYLDYSRNNFSSIIPEAIGSNISFTIFFSLSSNKFHGSIPESICNATYLQVLDLSNNSLSSKIPQCLTKMSGTLGVLNLRGNNLIGNIPDTFPGNCRLKTLNLNGNYLEGLLPKSLANCTELDVLDLGKNQINDNFPCWLKNISSLSVLVLRSNKFHGSIGCGGGNYTWEMLQIVDLASNNFSGEPPSQWFSTWKAMMPHEDEAQSKLNHLRFEFLGLNQMYYQDAVTVTGKGQEMELVKILTIFTSIDFSSNNFHGEIPEVLGDLKSLYILNLSYNSFTGQIPTALANLRQLESLDLSWNNLNGAIPMQLASLNFLSFLNLSFNQLEGMIPKGNQFQTFSEFSFGGNKGLCGNPLKKKCKNTDAAPPAMPSSEDTASSSANEFDWQFIMTGWGFGVGAGIIVGPLMFSDKGRKWFDEFTDGIILMILPALGLLYSGRNNGRVEAEETSDEELTDSTEDYDDDDPEDEMEGGVFRGQYCLFCSKLDISIKKAIHNPNCSCHHSPTISSSSSLLSSSSEARISEL